MQALRISDNRGSTAPIMTMRPDGLIGLSFLSTINVPWKVWPARLESIATYVLQNCVREIYIEFYDDQAFTTASERYTARIMALNHLYHTVSPCAHNVQQNCAFGCIDVYVCDQKICCFITMNKN